MARGGVFVDAALLADIEAARQADREDAPLKAAAASELGLLDAALVHEGFVVHRPAPAVLLEALQAARQAAQQEALQAAPRTAERQAGAADSAHAAKPSPSAMSLRLVSGGEATLNLLAGLGADWLAAPDSALWPASYLGVIHYQM
jgi:hypothetical protein